MKTIKVIGQTPNTHEGAPSSIKESVKNRKTTAIEIPQNQVFILCVPLRYFIIPLLKALTEKLTSEKAKND